MYHSYSYTCNIEIVERRAARFVTSEHQTATILLYSVIAMVGDLQSEIPAGQENIHPLTYYILQLKILHNIVDIPLLESIIPSTTTNYTRGYNLRFYLPYNMQSQCIQAQFLSCTDQLME